MTAHDWLDAYLLGMPGATTDYKVEWEWQRYQVGGKMFAATMQPGPQHPQPVQLGRALRHLIKLTAKQTEPPFLLREVRQGALAELQPLPGCLHPRLFRQKGRRPFPRFPQLCHEMPFAPDFVGPEPGGFPQFLPTP